jgi:AcrR family transcriptional regulator
MGRKPTVDADRILAVARKVFLEKGIRATTAEVARRAHVAEGSIFNRFPTKGDLFREAMKVSEPPWVFGLPKRIGAGEIEAGLVELGKEITDFFRLLMPLVMLSWSNPTPTGFPEILTGPNPPPLLVVKALAGYFEGEMRLGRISRHDPEIAARLFLGGLQNFVMLELLARSQEILPLPIETYLRGMVSLLLRGLQPEGKKLSGGSRK